MPFGASNRLFLQHSQNQEHRLKPIFCMKIYQDPLDSICTQQILSNLMPWTQGGKNIFASCRQFPIFLRSAGMMLSSQSKPTLVGCFQIQSIIIRVIDNLYCLSALDFLEELLRSLERNSIRLGLPLSFNPSLVFLKIRKRRRTASDLAQIILMAHR